MTEKHDHSALEERVAKILLLPKARHAERFRALRGEHPEHEALLLRWEAELEHVPDPDQLTEQPAEAPSMIGAQVGPYRILERLGEGGMGTVYVAEQLRPVRRRVALKVIKLGMDSNAIVARFEQERQALAVMDHDAIAKVFDGGTTERGQPWFAMELVEGLPLTRYCDEHELALEERIALFQQVCAGVQHAHHKGVIHRDLKPANVLVARRGDQHVPKIIDFGIARATGAQLVDETIFTAQGMMVGTPEYMSPEQAGSDSRKIDTRTDVYSLGVILYELLTGSLPFDSQQLRMAGLAEIQRVLREDEPPRPSARVTANDRRTESAAGRRRTTVSDLRARLRRDLDPVVLMAMAKEPERRYESPHALMNDLQRFLDLRPVLASPPSLGYRLRKLVRRNRITVLAAAAVLVTALVGGLAALKYAFDAGQSLRRFDQLSGVVRHDELLEVERSSATDWPHRPAVLQRWLVDCDALLAMRPRLENTLAVLREEALPRTEGDRRADMESHPRFEDWQWLEQTVESLRRAHAIRTGATKFVAAEVPDYYRRWPASDLRQAAYARVYAFGSRAGRNRRIVAGEEDLGLALARLAAERADGSESPYLAVQVVAWGLLANGLDEEALALVDAALADSSETEREVYSGIRAVLEAEISYAAQELEQVEAELAALTAEVADRRTWRFPPQRESDRFLHDTIVALVGRLETLAEQNRPDVERRLAWAERIDELTFAHPNARVTWEATRRALASSPRYRDAGIELRDRDVLGLVPLGSNPVTGYLEFYHLRSAWDGASDPAEIAIPEHRPDGKIAVGDATGIVFVLLPGGAFRMGSQDRDRAGPNYDEAKTGAGRVVEITLEPFLLARHEVTQGQWARLWSGPPAGRSPSLYGPDTSRNGRPLATLAHPVERVDWYECDRLLWEHGLELPTEAQWEYGCRAGTTSPWICEAEDLRHFANCADLTARSMGAPWQVEMWNDGFDLHAPVGSLRANAFGLHDVLGNVAEWCRDIHVSYFLPVEPGTGLRLIGKSNSTNRVYRGGSFANTRTVVRSAQRMRQAPSNALNDRGLRAARPLRR